MKAKIEGMGGGGAQCPHCRNAHEGNVKKEAIIAALESKVGDVSNDSQEVQDMLDMLKSYWKLSSKRYIDNVALQIVDFYTSPDRIADMERKLSDLLVSGLVSGLSDGSIVDFFSQPPKIVRRRQELEEKRARLTKASERIAKGLCTS